MARPARRIEPRGFHRKRSATFGYKRKIAKQLEWPLAIDTHDDSNGPGFGSAALNQRLLRAVNAMKVFLESFGTTAPWHDRIVRLPELASTDEVGRHALVADRASADIVLAVFNAEPCDFRLKHDERRFAYCDRDTVFPRLPGLYPSASDVECGRAALRSASYCPSPGKTTTWS